MALLCKFFGHKYKKRLTQIQGQIHSNGMRFDPKVCSDVLDSMRQNGENPLFESVCERCGHTESKINKFLNLYKR